MKQRFQPNIEELGNEIHNSHPDISFFKEGPAQYENKTNIVGYNATSFLKGYTKQGEIAGTKEIELITLFNDFSNQTGANFTGPNIQEISKDPLFFVMDDIRLTGKEEIDFSITPENQLIHLYSQYREVFDEFEIFTKGKTSSDKNPILQKYAKTIKIIETKIKKLEEQLGVINLATKKLVTGRQEAQIREWFAIGKDFVSSSIEYDEDSLISKLGELQSKVKKYDFEYNFGRFRSGHVFSDGQQHQLVDFDNIGYQIKGSELLGIVWSNLLLPVEKYNDYYEWKHSFELWYKQLVISTNNEDLARLLLFQKLIGTIFMDFGHLMLTLPHNIAKIENLGINPEDNSKKGIEWNYKLLQELFTV